MKHVFQAIYSMLPTVLEHNSTIHRFYMPGAGGIAYAVLNFRRLEFSSLAQDTEEPIALK